MGDILTTAQRVEKILEFAPIARNSDTELLLIYMQKMGMNLTPTQMDKFRDMPSAETLTRIRRKLQEQGKYPADKVVEEARYNKFKEYQDPEKLLESQGVKVLPWGQ